MSGLVAALLLVLPGPYGLSGYTHLGLKQPPPRPWMITSYALSLYRISRGAEVKVGLIVNHTTGSFL